LAESGITVDTASREISEFGGPSLEDTVPLRRDDSR
jgi:hypothetical protein